MKVIPKSVRKMLARAWQYRNASYCEPLADFEHFEIIKDDYPTAKRGKRFSAAHDEIVTLVDDGVLINLSDDAAMIVIDHQEQAALNFFCAQVYCAWQEYQQRMKRWRLLRDHAITRKHWADKQGRLITRQQTILNRQDARAHE